MGATPPGLYCGQTEVPDLHSKALMKEDVCGHVKDSLLDYKITALHNTGLVGLTKCLVFYSNIRLELVCFIQGVLVTKHYISIKKNR